MMKKGERVDLYKVYFRRSIQSGIFFYFEDFNFNPVAGNTGHLFLE